MTSVADKRVKIETDIVCDICYQNFETVKHRQDHYAKKHLVRTGTYGCSSCGEFYADEEQHRLHHDNVHKTKRIGYKCPMCTTKVAYSLTKFEKHVASCVDPFYSTVHVVDNIVCAKCKCRFETRNLFDWHGCFIANKKPCMKCNRVFVKKATLWRHIFTCDATPETKLEPVGGPHMVHIPNTNISANAKGPKKTALPATKSGAGRPRKLQNKQVSVNFKAEPETILEPVGEASESVYDPVKELQTLLGTSGSAESVHDSIVSPVEESDLFGFDDVADHFGDDGADSDADDSPMPFADELVNSNTASSLPPCTVNLEMINFTDFASITINNVDMLDEAEDEAEQVTQSEELEEQTAHEPVAPEETANIEPEPSTSQAADVRQPLTMRIKREVMNPGYGDVPFNPVLARNMKREKSAPVHRPNARKSTAKPTYTIIHSNLNAALGKQLFDPVLARNIKREKGAVNQPEAGHKSTSNVAQPNDENVTGALFDPVLARNIKREKATDNTRLTARKSTAKPTDATTTSAFDPVLARNIKREKGVQPPANNTSTSSVNPIAGPSNAVGSDSGLFDPVLARNIKREKDVEKQPTSLVRPNPLAVASTLAANPTKVSKKMYKMALLAEKIRQERLAREGGEPAALSTEETSNSSTSSQNVTQQNHTNSPDDTSSNSTPLPTNAEEMDANESQSLPSEGNELRAAAEQTTFGLAEIIPFKPIRLSTDFRKLESSTNVPAVVAEVADSSTLEVPFTISKVVSLTSIDAIESQSLESVTNERESEHVECDNRLDLDDTANDKMDTGNEAQDDETNEIPDDETPAATELESDKNAESVPDENESVAADAIVGKSNEQIEEKSDINGNGHSSDILTNQTQDIDTDFQSKVAPDKNTIMASLEALEQIVTELEKSDHSLAAENAPNAENGNGATDAQSDANDALPMETGEAESSNDSDRIVQADVDMSVIGSDAKLLPNSSLATDECEPNDLNEDIVRDNENDGSELLELLDTPTLKQPSEDMECTQNEIAEYLDATQTNQGSVNTNLTGLDDISDDSMGFSELI